MEKKKKIIIGIIIIIILIISSLAIYITNNENNIAESRFKRGEKINLEMAISSMDFNTIENEIKNKVNNNWTDLNNAINDLLQIKLNESSSYLTRHDEHLKTKIKVYEQIGWKVEKNLSSSFSEGYETWDYYVFEIKYSELTVKGGVPQSDYEYADIIIKKTTGESRLSMSLYYYKVY
ncbi:MAG: hypothetical protein FWE58_04585 [Methanobrevibacter sp.]|nr:hypothetical protein [Methanobrevibacter sp.]